MSDLKDIFKQAAEIAQSVPENMQVAAFNRALDLLTTEDDREVSRGGRARKRSPKRSAGTHGGQQSAEGPNSAKKTPTRKSASGLGPKSAITSLIESGFLGNGKTRAEVQAHLRTTRGYNIGTDQLGMAMLRLVRDGVLERTENEDGEYEFKVRTS